MRLPTGARTVRMAAGGAFFFIIILIGLPDHPWVPHPGLDGSFILAVGHVFRSGAVFGRDVLYTYGPLGFLAPSFEWQKLFEPSSWPLAYLFWGGFNLTVALAILWLGRDRPAGVRLTVWATVLVAHYLGHEDGTFLSMVLLAPLLQNRDDRPSGWLLPALAAVYGVVALVKVSYFLCALLVFLLTDAAALAGRRVPRTLAVFLAAHAVAFALTGGGLSDFLLYLTGSLHIVAGYQDAHQLPGGREGLPVFLASGAAVLLAAAMAGPPRRVLPVAAATAALVFLLYKAGYVRPDNHLRTTWTGIAIIAALLLAGLPATGGAAGGGTAGGRRWPAAVLAVLCLGWTTHNTLRIHEIRAYLTPRPGDLAGKLAAVLAPGKAAAVKRVQGAALAAIRERSPLDTAFIRGSVDIYPYEQSLLLAHGLDYRPRPVFQSHLVTDPHLAGRNRAFLHGPRAPDSIVFTVAPVDDDFPAQDEGALWPDLLRLYDPVDVGGPYAILRRRTTPRPVLERGLGAVTLRLGEEAAVPGEAPLLFVRIRPARTPAGALYGLAWASPGLRMTLRLRSGETRHHRLVPGKAALGFLLSPVVESGAGLVAALARAACGVGPSPSLAVERLSVTLEHGPSFTVEDRVEVDFAALEMAAGTEEPVSPRLAALAAEACRP